MLATAPVLASPLSKEPMLLYIAATNRVVSAVIVVERDEEGKSVQRPVYYLSEVLSASKQNYPHFQKVAYGVYMAAKKLKHYFEEHPIKVICEAPISEIMGNKDASGRIANWAIELAPYAPQYDRREAIKSQAVPDFFPWVIVEREEEGKLVQRPVYYLSEVLSASKQNYLHYQKVAYGVYMSAKKLKHYFEEHPIKVICEAPISEIMGNKDASGRIAKWAIELAPYAPQYDRREAIKSQAMVDFFVDWAEVQYEPPPPDPNYWRMHFDGSNMVCICRQRS